MTGQDFGGAYISSLTTIYVLYKTTKQTRSIQVENHKNSIKPSVDLDISDGGWIIYKEDKQNIYIDEIVLGRKNTDEPYDQEKNTMHDIWELKLDIINLSQNPAKNIKIIIQPLYEDFKVNLQELKLPFKYSDKNKIIEIDDAGYLDFKKNLKENETEYRHLGSNRVIEHTVYVPFLGYKDVFDKLLEQYISTANYFITGDSEFKKKNLCTYNISLYYQDVELTEYNKQFKLDFIIYYVSKKDHRVSVEIKITDFSVK